MLHLSLVLALKKKKIPRIIKQLLPALLTCNTLVRNHLGVRWKGRVMMVFSILIFQPICPFLRPCLSSEAELETGSQTAVYPDRGEHCPEEVAPLPTHPETPPLSLKFSKNERDIMLEPPF